MISQYQDFANFAIKGGTIKAAKAREQTNLAGYIMRFESSIYMISEYQNFANFAVPESEKHIAAKAREQTN